MFKLFRPLEQGEQLVCGGDPSEGGDYCVGVWASKKHNDAPLVYEAQITSSEFAYQLESGSKYVYHETGMWPTIGVERNKGTATIEKLTELHYPNQYRMQIFNKAERSYENKLGWDTNKKTRRMMLDDFKDAIDNQWFIVYDEVCVKQMMKFGWKNDKWQALSGHDDNLLAHMIAYELIKYVPLYNPPTESRPEWAQNTPDARWQKIRR